MIALLFAAALASEPTEAERQLADLRHMYAQSCAVRAYASFDDLCGVLKKQVKAAERTVKKEAARKPAADR